VWWYLAVVFGVMETAMADGTVSYLVAGPGTELMLIANAVLVWPVQYPSTKSAPELGQLYVCF
jgi:hypothetical protein